MKKRLKKDLVIPAGTIFETAPTKTERHGEGHVEHVVGLSDNTSGVVTYFAGPEGSEESKELSEWFEDVEA